MATIRRHPVPPESFQPDRPFNDLGRDQLRHFIHIAEKLPPGLRWEGEPPSPEDGPASTRFITAVTEHMLSLRKAGPTLVSSRPVSKPRKIPTPREGLVDIAAKAASNNPKPAAKKAVRPKASNPGGRKP